MSILDYLRSFRIGEYAIFDFAVSFIGMALLAPLLTRLFRKIRIAVPPKNWIALTIPLSIPAHLLFGQLTPFTTNFLDLHGHYVLKGLVLSLLVYGLTGIKLTTKQITPPIV